MWNNKKPSLLLAFTLLALLKENSVLCLVSFSFDGSPVLCLVSIFTMYCLYTSELQLFTLKQHIKCERSIRALRHGDDGDGGDDTGSFSSEMCFELFSDSSQQEVVCPLCAEVFSSLAATHQLSPRHVFTSDIIAPISHTAPSITACVFQPSGHVLLLTP